MIAPVPSLGGPPVVTTRFQRLVARWDSHSNVHRSEYSMKHFRLFDRYCLSAPWYRVLAVCLFMIVPPILILVVTESMPLRPPSEGWRSSYSYTTRTFYAATSAVFGIVMQLYVIAPRAELTMGKMTLISLVSGLGFTGVAVLLTELWAFPVPWTLVIVVPPWVTLFVLSVVMSIGRRKLMTRPEVRKELMRFVSILSVNCSLIFVYPSYNAVFLRLSGLHQLAFLILLPVIKITMRKLVGLAVADSGEMIPVLLITVDMFDALFLAKCMQNTNSFWTGAGLIALDVVENYFGIARLQYRTRDVESAFTLANGVNRGSLLDSMKLLCDVPQTLNSAESSSVLKQVDMDPNVDPPESAAEQSANSNDDTDAEPRAPEPTARHAQIAPAPPVIKPLRSPMVSDSSGNLANSKPSVARIVITRSGQNAKTMKKALELLYRSEFILLVEFIECAVPFLYVIYLLIIFHIPNARYNPDVAHISPERLHQIVASIMTYAFLEFVSLCYIHIIFKRRFGISAFHQLGFILERNFVYLQGLLITWSVLVFQFTLMHYGSDFTFRFEWLHPPEPKPTD